MFIELARVADMIEWAFEPNRIVGSIRTRDDLYKRSVRIRLEGFSVKERDRVRADAQLSISLDIIKDIYDGRISDTTNLGSNRGVDAEPEPKQGAGRGRASKKNTKASAKAAVRAGGPDGGSAD